MGVNLSVAEVAMPTSLARGGGQKTRVGCWLSPTSLRIPAGCHYGDGDKGGGSRGARPSLQSPRSSWPSGCRCTPPRPGRPCKGGSSETRGPRARPVPRGFLSPSAITIFIPGQAVTISAAALRNSGAVAWQCPHQPAWNITTDLPFEISLSSSALEVGSAIEPPAATTGARAGGGPPPRPPRRRRQSLQPGRCDREGTA